MSAEDGPVRTFADLRPTGLLWLINASVFHPRGYTLAITFDDAGEAIGWQLLGDGTERWTFDRSMDADIDALFLAVRELMP